MGLYFTLAMKEDEEIGVKGASLSCSSYKIKHTIHVADVLRDCGKTERYYLCHFS